MNEAEKEFIDLLKKIEQALPVIVKLIDEGKIGPVALRGASIEDTLIRLEIPSECTLATAEIQEIVWAPYLKKKLTVFFEKI